MGIVNLFNRVLDFSVVPFTSGSWLVLLVESIFYTGPDGERDGERTMHHSENESFTNT